MRRHVRFLLPGAMALCLAVSGCGTEEESSAQPSTVGTTDAAGNEAFPNLATVPDQAPPSTPKIERETLAQGLLADRAHAEYTGETLGENAANVTAAAPPPPAPPAPEGEAEKPEGEDGESDEAEVEAPPPAPAELAALPAYLGEPAALIYFGGDTADLTDRDRAILRDVALKYTGERGSRVRVIGHSSGTEKPGSTGADGFDLALARADTVAKVLIGMGIPATALETSTGGATYSESEPNGVAANRRVEVYIGS